MRLELYLTLKSDATFGRGDGVAGLVDAEVEHDECGLPFLRGRTLKGLLVEECANLLYALRQQNPTAADPLEKAAQKLFGGPGSALDDDGILHVGAARLPEDLRGAIEADVKAGSLRPEQVLESLTAIRRQAAVDEGTGAPDEGSLRSLRVLLRETPLVAKLDLARKPHDHELLLLAASVMCLRRAGTGRNRGRGRLKCRLHHGGNDITKECFDAFSALVQPCSAGKETAA